MSQDTAFKPAPPEPSDDVKSTYVGRTGRLVVDSFLFDVTVAEVRNRYGNLDVLVTPVAGKGERWVKASRIELI